MPQDGNWRAKLIRSGRKPETLAEVYLDKGGAPLIERVIALARVARRTDCRSGATETVAHLRRLELVV
jgi:hypothetical protein